MVVAVRPRVLRIITAAARLAALYALAVVVLFIALALWTDSWESLRVALKFNLRLFAVLFVASFVLLAAARRVGFAAIWLLLILAWVWPLARHGWTPIGLLVVFVYWSVAALPFYLLGIVGFPGRRVLRFRSWTAPLPALVLALWVLLLLFTLAVTPTVYFMAITGSFPEPPSVVLTLAPFVWAPAPVLIGLEALARLRPRNSTRPESTVPGV